MIQQPGSRSDSPGSSPLGSFGFAPLPHGSTAVLPGGPSSRSGFRIHEVGREPDRSPWRGRRFAFAAASAVSLAAIALGGALPTGAGSSAPARAAGAGNAVTPLDAASRGESNGSVSRRNGGGQGALAATEAGDSATAVAPPSVSEVTPAAPATAPALLSSATLVPKDLASGSLASGTLAPGTLTSGTLTGNTFGVPVLTNVSAPPLIRPTGTSPLFARVLGRLAPQPPPLPPRRPGRSRRPRSSPPPPTAVCRFPPGADRGLRRYSQTWLNSGSSSGRDAPAGACRGQLRQLRGDHGRREVRRTEGEMVEPARAGTHHPHSAGRAVPRTGHGTHGRSDGRDGRDRHDGSAHARAHGVRTSRAARDAAAPARRVQHPALRRTRPLGTRTTRTATGPDPRARHPRTPAVRRDERRGHPHRPHPACSTHRTWFHTPTHAHAHAHAPSLAPAAASDAAPVDAVAPVRPLGCAPAAADEPGPAARGRHRP